MVQFRRNDQLHFVIYHGCYGDGRHLELFIYKFVDFQNISSLTFFKNLNRFVLADNLKKDDVFDVTWWFLNSGNIFIFHKFFKVAILGKRENHRLFPIFRISSKLSYNIYHIKMQPHTKFQDTHNKHGRR